MENKIYNFAQTRNMIIGICDAKPLTYIKECLETNDTPFVPEDVKKRIDPKLTMEDTKSIIVAGISYNKKIDFENDKNLRGVFYKGGVGEDYHIAVRSILTELAAELGFEILDTRLIDKQEGNLREKTQYKYQAKIYSDNGNLIERELALKAGLGILGRNCSIISKKLGSVFNIGYILTNAELKASRANTSQKLGCFDCGRCVKFCPGKALSADKVKLDYTKCVSYLTQKKGHLTDDEMKSMGIQIYGCDVCIDVCPHNKEVLLVDTITNIDKIMPKLEHLITLTKEEFENTYKKTSSGWRGKKLFRRNALIALSNIGTKEAIKIIESYINDYDKDIRELSKRLLIIVNNSNKNIF